MPTLGRSYRTRWRDPFTFDRSDRWALIVLLGVCALATAAGGVGWPVAAWVRGEGLWLDAVGSVVVPTLDAAGVQYAAAEFVLLVSLGVRGSAPSAWLTFPLFPVVAGLGVALLAEAFRAGNSLRDDVDCLV
ncbi:MAG: hypothetical protein ACRCYX_04760 [Dermatophilaceae bacterium]